MTAAAPFSSKGEQKHHIRNKKLDGRKRQTWPNAFGSVIPSAHSHHHYHTHTHTHPPDTQLLAVFALFLSYCQKRNVAFRTPTPPPHQPLPLQISLFHQTPWTSLIVHICDYVWWGYLMFPQTESTKEFSSIELGKNNKHLFSRPRVSNQTLCNSVKLSLCLPPCDYSSLWWHFGWPDISQFLNPRAQKRWRKGNGAWVVEGDCCNSWKRWDFLVENCWKPKDVCVSEWCTSYCYSLYCDSNDAVLYYC